MGAPSLLALIFLLAAAIQLQTPTAFGQEQEKGQITGNPNEQPGQDSVTPPLPSAPSAPKLPCDIYKFLDTDLATQEYGAWTQETGKRLEILKARLSIHQELMDKLAQALRPNALDKNAYDEILANRAKAIQSQGIDESKLAEGGRLGAGLTMDADPKSQLKDKLMKVANDFMAQQGFVSNGWPKDGKLSDHYVGTYKRKQGRTERFVRSISDTAADYEWTRPDGVTLTIRLAETRWGTQLYIDSYLDDPTHSYADMNTKEAPGHGWFADKTFTQGLPRMLTSTLDINGPADAKSAHHAIRNDKLEEMDLTKADDVKRKDFFVSKGAMRADCAQEPKTGTPDSGSQGTTAPVAQPALPAVIAAPAKHIPHPRMVIRTAEDDLVARVNFAHPRAN
jgi:hypothetical protein